MAGSARKRPKAAPKQTAKTAKHKKSWQVGLLLLLMKAARRVHSNIEQVLLGVNKK